MWFLKSIFHFVLLFFAHRCVAVAIFLLVEIGNMIVAEVLDFFQKNIFF